MFPLYYKDYGSGSPALLLLHGLGVNGAAWDAVVKGLADWPGRIIVPDFRGHGRSPHTRHYSLAHHAADIAELVEPGENIHVVGHSMGGAVGLILGSGMFGVTVAKLTTFGTKTNFTDDELARIAKVVNAPARWFDTRDAAVERFLLVAGLTGLAAADSPVVNAGLVEEGGRWRLAADNAASRVAGPPDLVDLVKLCRAPFRLGCGSNDPAVTIDALRVYDPEVVVFDGCAHSAHVEAPDQVIALIRERHFG